MNMLVVVLFGHAAARDNWFTSETHWAGAVTRLRNPAGDLRAILPNGTEFRGIVLARPEDLDRLAGLYPAAVIQHDSLGYGPEFRIEVRHHLRAYM